VINHVSWWRT